MKQTEVTLSCECGSVTGVIKGVTPTAGNRVVCCCSDCQAFITFLKPGEEASVLDPFGGTEIYQTSQSQLTLSTGQEHLKSMRLSPKGLIRWYTDCCNTPIGNTMNASMPFVGVIHSFISDHDTDLKLGPVRAYVQLQHAKGAPDYPGGAQKFPLGITLRIIRKMLGWKMRGMQKPSVFFDDDGQPTSGPKIVS